MRYLVLSDIHANCDALDAVLEEAEGHYDQVVCLGDIVGYGPEPNRAVEWVREHAQMVVRGNHDKVAVGLDDVSWFNPIAEAAARWTMQELSEDNRRYLTNLPRGPVELSGFTLVHGSPLDEDGYLVGVIDAEYVVPYIEQSVTFFGHTHLQGGFTWSRHQVRHLERPAPWEPSHVVLIEETSGYLINPGSVGQPRDGDPRAGFAVYDTEGRVVTLYRRAYDIGTAQQKFRSAGLPEALAARLAVGR